MQGRDEGRVWIKGLFFPREKAARFFCAKRKINLRRTIFRSPEIDFPMSAG
ncbi:hypothetical protein HMPREF9441_03361 [Paraprevotella clara YIT 11840]|uniref:Uncharacterized protein n=1 Tax=Paraprevotella clara YIT 11840 TaxID=762968 RepID=G5SVI7_9BACT|nr:hypothetical protein HMPREF9441_03361 [Paraprevotella clara YIT 11840]